MEYSNIHDATQIVVSKMFETVCSCTTNFSFRKYIRVMYNTRTCQRLPGDESIHAKFRYLTCGQTVHEQVQYLISVWESMSFDTLIYTPNDEETVDNANRLHRFGRAGDMFELDLIPSSPFRSIRTDKYSE